MEQKPIIQQLRGGGAYDFMLGYLKIATIGWFLLVAVTLLGLVSVDPKAPTAWLRYGFAIWVALLAFGLFTFYRIAALLFLLLRTDQQTQRHEERRRAAR